LAVFGVAAETHTATNLAENPVKESCPLRLKLWQFDARRRKGEHNPLRRFDLR
jgi:hypothetical protein